MRLHGLLLGLALAGLGCSSARVEEHTLRVAVASSLRFAMEELAAEFERGHPQIDLEPTYGASGAFFAQLESRAPFDVFLSADLEYAEALQRKGLTHGDSFRYATGKLAAWASENGADGLDDPSIRKIAIANPRLAPYGRAAEQALAHLGIETEGKIVQGDSVAQALQFAQSGAADIALTAESLLYAPQLQGVGRSWSIPTEAYEPIEHAGAILAWARDMAAAEAFRDFLLGPNGREILGRYGFAPPES